MATKKKKKTRKVAKVKAPTLAQLKRVHAAADSLADHLRTKNIPHVAVGVTGSMIVVYLQRRSRLTRNIPGSWQRVPVLTTASGAVRPLAAGASDIGFRERKLREAIAESRLQADVDEVRRMANESEPHVVSEPSTHEEIMASDNAVIREAYIKALVPREPECHTYVAPEPSEVPALPNLTGVALEFHTTRCFTWSDIAFALLPEAGVVIRRSHDRLNGGATYLLAGSADLDEHQYGGEIGSHHWYEATDEQHDVIAACDPDAPPQPFEEAVGVAR
jgi:hypothetical protein